MSFEAPNHYLKLTARENLEYFRSLYDGKADSVEDVLALVGLVVSRKNFVEAEVRTETQSLIAIYAGL